MAAVDATLAVLGLPGSALLRAAASTGLESIAEGFADRGYRSDGGLVPRGSAGDALGREDAIGQACGIVARHIVVSAGGTVVPLAVRSLCIHGDTPGAVELAR